MPTTDAMLTIEPERAFIMTLAAARVIEKTPVRFVAMTASQSSSVMRTIRPSRVMPALLTRMSSAPYWATTLSTSAVHAAGSLTSACRAPARPPAATMASTTPSAASREPE